MNKIFALQIELVNVYLNYLFILSINSLFVEAVCKKGKEDREVEKSLEDQDYILPI